jgi:glycerol-3-phosphate acyltransferase PlsY
MERIAAAVILGYVIGSVPFSLIIGKFVMGIDLRQHGSGNLGAANTFRTLGGTSGVAVLLLDASKGAAGAVVGSLLWREGLPLGQTELMLLGGLASVCGHVWTVFAAFKGGKGVAAAAGMFVAIAPAAFAISLGVWLVVVVIWRYVSLGSVVAGVVLPFSVFATCRNGAAGWQSVFVVSALVAILVVWAHRGNLGRLLDGTERRLTFRRGEQSE